MLVPPSFGEVRPAVIDVPPSGERRPAVILVPPNGLARPGRAILVPPSGLARPVGAGAGAGASPSEVGEGAASAAFRLSRAAAAFGRVIFMDCYRRDGARLSARRCGCPTALYRCSATPRAFWRFVFAASASPLAWALYKRFWRAALAFLWHTACLQCGNCAWLPSVLQAASCKLFAQRSSVHRAHQPLGVNPTPENPPAGGLHTQHRLQKLASRVTA